MFLIFLFLSLFFILQADSLFFFECFVVDSSQLVWLSFTISCFLHLILVFFYLYCFFCAQEKYKTKQNKNNKTKTQLTQNKIKKEGCAKKKTPNDFSFVSTCLSIYGCLFLNTNKANPNILDSNGVPAILKHCVKRPGASGEVVAAMLECGAYPNVCH